MLLHDALEQIQSLVPESLAESWDPVGLHVGAADWTVSRTLLTIDLTVAVIDEAKSKGCDLIISYHPPIFKGIERLTDQGWQTQRILKAAQENIAVYSSHTALDAAAGGVCDWLCDGVVGSNESGSQRRPIAGKAVGGVNHKVVVFVPVDAEEAVRQAMSEAGAGWIGQYRECSFSAPGVGGFRPLEGANPTIGKVGTRETVDERRMEMIVPAKYLAKVVAAARASHPYEEPAMDIFRLEPESSEPVEPSVGAGRLLTLAQAVAVNDLADRLNNLLGLSDCRVINGDREAKTIAVCPGAGGSLFEGVDADLYITGEMRHHDALDYQQRGKSVLLSGHTHTERPYLPEYARRLASVCEQVTFSVADSDRCPWAPQVSR